MGICNYSCELNKQFIAKLTSEKNRDYSQHVDIIIKFLAISEGLTTIAVYVGLCVRFTSNGGCKLFIRKKQCKLNIHISLENVVLLFDNEINIRLGR